MPQATSAAPATVTGDGAAGAANPNGTGSTPVESLPPLSDAELSAPYNYLNAFIFGGEGGQATENAIAGAVAECMATAGWDFTPPPIQTDEPVQYKNLGAFVSSTQQYGYTPPTPTSADDDAVNAEWEAFDQKLNALGGARSEYFLALYGPTREPSDPDTIIANEGTDQGCDGQARYPVLLRSPIYTMESLGANYSDIVGSVQSDPRIVAANQKWIQCMADDGLAYDDPYAPPKQFRRDPDTPATPEELSVARADAGCYTRTIHPVRLEVEAEVIQDLVDKYPEWAPAMKIALNPEAS